MNYRIGKYEFNSKEQAKEKIEALNTTDENGEVVPTNNTIVELGYLTLEQSEINDEGEVIKEAVLSDKYHVDALFKDLDDHPYGWKSYAIDIDDEGTHSFLGLSYTSLKF